MPHSGFCNFPQKPIRELNTTTDIRSGRVKENGVRGRVGEGKPMQGGKIVVKTGKGF